MCIFLKLKEKANLPGFRRPTLFYRSVDNLENADVLSDFPLNATDPSNQECLDEIAIIGQLSLVTEQ